MTELAQNRHRLNRDRGASEATNRCTGPGLNGTSPNREEPEPKGAYATTTKARKSPGQTPGLRRRARHMRTKYQPRHSRTQSPSKRCARRRSELPGEAGATHGHVWLGSSNGCHTQKHREKETSGWPTCVTAHVAVLGRRRNVRRDSVTSIRGSAQISLQSTHHERRLHRPCG